MYYEHFGLTQAPFRITPNTEFFFSGGNRGPVLEALIYAITRGEGIVKVTGEVGSGKTMLCSMLQNRLPANVESVYLANPSVAPEDVLHAIAFELQLGLDRKADRLEVQHALQDYLVKRHAEGKRVVVFVEETQSMPVATLEEIRLLSNLETQNDKLMQIVLFGQPELDELLRRPDIRQLRDRIAHSFRLQPLTEPEVHEYLMFRMRAAGYRGPALFTRRVVRRMAKASSGLTRRINLVADKALLAAFSENTHTIKTRHVQAALRDSEFGQTEPVVRFSPAFAWAGVAVVAGAVLGAGGYALFAAPHGSITPAESVAASVVDAAPAVRQPPAVLTPAVSARAQAAPPATLATAAVPVENAVAAEAPAATVVAITAPKSAAAALPAPATPAPTAHPTPEAVPPPNAAAPASDTPPPAADPITSRMSATQHWLRTSGTRGYSIQLLVAYNDEHLRDHLNALPKSIEVNDIYMYRSESQGRPIVNVLWGSFADRSTALEHLAELPRSLRANRPYVRTVSGIRAEIERLRQ